MLVINNIFFYGLTKFKENKLSKILTNVHFIWIKIGNR